MENERENLEIKKLEMMLQLEQIKRENQAEVTRTSGASTPNVSLRPRGPKLPMYQEGRDSMDSYLHRFENYAIVQGWD